MHKKERNKKQDCSVNYVLEELRYFIKRYFRQ